MSNLGSVVYDDVYIDHRDKPEPETEESIAERTKLRRKRSGEIAKKEKMINCKLFRQYFECLNPNGMYKNLNKTADSEKNKAKVNTIKYTLANLIEKIKSNPTSDAKKIKNRNNMLQIVEKVF